MSYGIKRIQSWKYKRNMIIYIFKVNYYLIIILFIIKLRYILYYKLKYK